MAVLTTTERAAINTEIMQEASEARAAIPVLKAELRAVINAADDWIEANLTAYNTALPLPGRTALSQKQKLRLLIFVLIRKWRAL